MDRNFISKIAFEIPFSTVLELALTRPIDEMENKVYKASVNVHVCMYVS